jgi:N-acetylneuraminic acid mutarotase
LFPSFFLVKIKQWLLFVFQYVLAPADVSKTKAPPKKRIVVEAESLTEFLEQYTVARKESHGKAYFRWRAVVATKEVVKTISATISRWTWMFTWRGGLVTAVFVLVLYITGTQVSGAPYATSVNTKAEWGLGTSTNLSLDSATDAIQLMADGSWEARTWAVPPDTVGPGSSSIFVDGSLYVMRGYADKAFWRYDPTQNEWVELEDLPFPSYYGADMVSDGIGGIYIIFGGYSKKFYRYDTITAGWTALPDLLDTTWTGASISFDGTDPYVLRGNASTDFWRYDVSLGDWQSLAPISATASTGANLVYGRDGNFYTPRGVNTLTFYSYNIATNTWSAKANITTGYNFNGDEKGSYVAGSIYYLRSAGTSNFLKYDIGGNSWTVLSATPAAANFTPSAYNDEDGLIYVLRGNNTYDLWKFDPAIGATGDWVGPQQVMNNTITMGTGSNLLWNGVTGAGSYVYALRGGTLNFYRYDTAANSWTAMANLPATVTTDVKGVLQGNYIYYPRGGGTTTFYRYTISTNTWTTMTAPPATLTNGSSLAYSSATSRVYALRGGGTSTFYSTDVNVTSWATLSSMVVGGVTYNANIGARMASDGTDLYVTVGDGETAFLKYTTGTDTWSTLLPTPFAQYYGTSMTYVNGKIIALAGYYKDETWEYTIATNTWRLLPSNQKYLYGRGPYNGADIEYAGGNSFYALSGLSTTDMWSYTAGTNNFVSTGSYVSEALDVAQASNWVSFVVNDTTPANTSVIYETRTSTDASSWSAWEAVSGTTIASPAQRYIQVRITLATSDGVSTPTVSDYTITYNNSDTPPTNPSAVNAYSQVSGGVTLSSGATYLYEHPYFTFSGASSPEAGVEGYYVYFGTNASADPVADGSFQMNTTYEVNVALDADTYYLRIKTQDNNGNISAATYAAFTYVYNGVAPALVETKTSQADFSAGVLSDVSATDVTDALRLSASAGSGFWNQTRITNSPANMSYGGDSVRVNYNGNDYIFALRGVATNGFYRYDLATDTWTAMAVTPGVVSYGGSIEAGPGGYLYATQGGNLPTFWKYNIATDTWTAVASAPKNFYIGGSISYDGSRYIYGLPGSDDAFYRYDTTTDTWSARTNANFGNPNSLDGQTVNYDSGSIYDGRNNIYVTQGNYYPYFSKYSIATDAAYGETANTWTVLASAPVGIYQGGSLAYDTTTGSVYLTRGNWKDNYFRYDVGTNSWSQLPDTPAAFSLGASQNVYNGYIYALRGGNTTSFYRYNIAESSWEIPTQGLFGPTVPGGASYFPFYYGTFAVADDSENLYLIRGYYDNVFVKYNIPTGTVTEMAKLPVGAYDGSSLVYVGNHNEIYYSPGTIRTTRSGASNYFYKYDIPTNTWSEITTDRPPVQVGVGSSMTYDGTRYIYMTRGAGQTTWWRYDLDGSDGSRWFALPTTGAPNVTTGGEMVYNGGYIYSVRGGNNTNYRYDIGAGTWATMPVLPATISTGASIADGGDGYIYMTRGANTANYYRYRLADGLSGTWESVTDMPAQVNIGGFQKHASNRNWVIAGSGTNSYSDGLYSYVVSSTGNGTGFQKTGTYTSETLDLVSVYKWANFSASYTLPNNTFVTFETRTSADGLAWDDWTAVSNEQVFGTNHVFKINSAPDGYIEVRANLSSSDRIFSPLITDYAVSYYQDIAEPTNPSAVSAYTSVAKTAGITTNTWYNHAAPYFEWPAVDAVGGATDGVGGSGVAGYYVYFGIDSNADPVTFQTTTNYTASGLSAGQTYYLKIMTKDNAGMISPTAYSAFSYKFDNIAPANPSIISVSPTGYTAIDNYAFTWSGDASDAFSGVAKFQYRTDGDVTDTWVDITNPSQVALAIPNVDHIVGAYQSGKNKFYLRVVDGAGNASSTMTQEYYFSASAPTPPQNLTASPTTATENSFAFSWDTPASFAGDESELVYRYSVNVLPTANNTVSTPLTSAGPSAFATQKGENLFFVVAQDESGNIEYGNYAVVSFTADTSNPPIPGNVQIFDTSDRENSKYGIAVKWTRPDGIDASNFDGFVIYRSEDNLTFTEIAKTTGSAYVDSGEIVLASGDTTLESKLYYYYIKSKDKTSNYSAASSTVSILPTGKFTTAPKLVGTPSYTTQSFQATFTWATDRVASSFIEYGKTISLGETTGQVDSVTTHEVLVKGLDAGTKYFYRVKYIDPDGNIGTSNIDTLTTLDPPIISDVTVTDIQLYTAYVNWTTNVSATCTLKYGSYSIEETSGGAGHVQRIDKLQPASDYQAQIECIDGDLNSFSSDQYSFSTPEEPVVSGVTIENKENVDLPTIAITYTTNVPTSTLIYYKSAANGNHTYLAEELVTEHTAEISDLEPAVEYAITVTGNDQYHIQAKAYEQIITTRTDSRPPKILSNKSMGRVSGRGNSAQANVYIKIETDEPSRIHVAYAKGIVSKSFEQSTSDDAFNTYHLITIPAEAGDVYSYQVEAFDEAANKSTADAVTVAVEQSKANATEVITRTFLNNFGWITRLQGGN